jgi:hypothetical protein
MKMASPDDAFRMSLGAVKTPEHNRSIIGSNLYSNFSCLHAKDGLLYGQWQLR